MLGLTPHQLFIAACSVGCLLAGIAVARDVLPFYEGVGLIAGVYAAGRLAK